MRRVLLMTALLCAVVSLVAAGVCAAGPWHIETVDTPSAAGHSSLAVDASGYPHISYQGGSLRLMYAAWNGSGWAIQEVGAGGPYPSLALDANGYPHIAYDSSGTGPSYGAWNGTSWDIQTVDSVGVQYTSLALDASGHPHIGYYDYGAADLRYATRNGSSWDVQVVDSAGDVGRYLSLALDANGYPHISYCDQSSQYLKYAAWNGASWDIQIVDQDGGQYSSLALAASGYPRISYHDWWNDDLKYAAWNGSGWDIQTVDSVTQHSSLALDANGYAHVSYHDLTNHDLKYAAWNGSGWEIETIESAGLVGEYTSLALDTSGYPHISYCHSFPYPRLIKHATTRDIRAPAVVSATYVDPTHVDVEFSEELDQATAEVAGNYSVSPSLTVEGAVLDANGTTVHLTTDTQAMQTTYTVTVSNVRDLTGNVVGPPENQAQWSTPDTPPPPVTALTAQDHPSDSGGAIDLDWTGYSAPPDFQHYNIYRSTSSFSDVSGMTAIATLWNPSETTYTDRTTADGTDYYYAVTCVDAAANEDPSVTCVGPVQSAHNGTLVTFPDPNLEAVIREVLGKPTGPIYDLDLLGLTDLDARNRDISDLTGLEHCGNLITLNLGRNQIADISPLAALTNLYDLDLEQNQIADIAPLSGLTSLTSLDAAYNDIADIAPLSGLTSLTALSAQYNWIADIGPLSGLTNLRYLKVGGNDIADIGALSGLTNLWYLFLYHNQIADISPLSGLTKVIDLRLNRNQISDIGALVANSGLGTGDTIRLQNNWLDLGPGSQASQDVQTLRDRGATVDVDPQNIPPVTTLAAQDHPDDNGGAIDLDWTGYSAPSNFDHYNIYRSSASFTYVAFMTPIGTVASASQTTYTDATTTDGTDYYYAVTCVDTDSNENTSVTCVGPVQSLDNVVTFPDPNLEAAIREAINKPAGDIYDSDLLGLTQLDASERDISDLSGLEHCTGLITLWLHRNQIADIAPLSGLTNLTRLSLTSDEIADIAPLSGLTNLTYLTLGSNEIADIAPLSALTNLTLLSLGGNEIADIGPLSGLTNLTYLTLFGNEIADIGPLSALTNLTTLFLERNQITDIGALVANSGLGTGDTIRLQNNWLDLSEGSQASQDVQTLRDRGATVYVDNQIAHSLHALPATGYYMISFPLIPHSASATPHDVLCDDLGDGNYYMWRWEGGGYQTIPTSPPECQTTTLSIEEGYWILAQDATLDIGGTQPSGDQAIPLQAGWNMVAPPYEATMDSLRVDNGGDVRSLAEAQTAGWVLATFYYSHDGTGSYQTVTIGRTPAEALSSWHGYWVLAALNCSLIVPEPSGGAGAAAIRAAHAAQPQPTWALDIQATSGSFADSLTIAASDSASDGFDGFALDKPKPPSPPGEGRLRLVLRGKGRRGRASPPYNKAPGRQMPWSSELAMETRGATQQEVEWEFTVTGGAGGEPVTLTWPELSLLPKDRVAMLTDQDTGKRTFMRTRAHYEFAAPGEDTTRSFAVTVKPVQQAGALISNFSVLPLRGGRGAEIAFGLSADASVDISIVNVAGRLVQRVQQSLAAEAGRHTAAWNARSLSDTPLPNGLYLCVLEAKAPDGRQARRVCPLTVSR